MRDLYRRHTMALRRRTWAYATLYAGVVAALILSGGVGGICYHIRRDNVRESSTGLPFHPMPDARSRILVVAPHCDDETLGCGGLLHYATRRGSAVRVVVVTSGDGFHYAVQRAHLGRRIGPRDYRRFAGRRRDESRAALAHVGVPARDVLFLGYPDRGLAHLWLGHWTPDAAYASPYTRASIVPYPDAYHPAAPYCGEALLEDLERIIREFQPTAVYAPHPNDDHPDHWATSCFVRAALERLGLRDRVDAFAYLVHRGDWPAPRGWHRDRGLSPPAAMARLDTLWSALPLDAAAAAAKEAALEEYRSQMAVMRRFLTSFVRRTELFGRFVPPTAAGPAPAGLRVDGDPSEWQAIPLAAQEPIEDSLDVELAGAADLTGIRVCHDERNLYILLSTRRPISRQLRYVLRLRTLGAESRALTVTVRPGKPPVPPATAAAARDRCIELAVPLAALGGADTLFVGAVARTRHFAIDSTGWRVVRLLHAAGQGEMRGVVESQ
ncbi:MAG: PIG-L family deacetylase [Armatimonadetes bacterium]|nr:PIG-L family deacetylase [Armatimonadota bacterium]